MTNADISDVYLMSGFCKQSKLEILKLIKSELELLGKNEDLRQIRQSKKNILKRVFLWSVLIFCYQH